MSNFDNLPSTSAPVVNPTVGVQQLHRIVLFTHLKVFGLNPMKSIYGPETEFYNSSVL
jgi:hypothetical protein